MILHVHPSRPQVAPHVLLCAWRNAVHHVVQRHTHIPGVGWVAELVLPEERPNVVLV
jgi:hypothetical protein